MENRVNDKIIEIERDLNNLKKIIPNNFNEYISDIKSRMACERLFEKIIEGIIGLTILIIKDRGFESPMSDREALNVLSDNGLISKKLSEKLSDAKSMRNIIIHEYGSIDDKLVFDAIKNELFIDVKEFLRCIK